MLTMFTTFGVTICFNFILTDAQDIVGGQRYPAVSEYEKKQKSNLQHHGMSHDMSNHSQKIRNQPFNNAPPTQKKNEEEFSSNLVDLKSILKGGYILFPYSNEENFEGKQEICLGLAKVHESKDGENWQIKYFFEPLDPKNLLTTLYSAEKQNDMINKSAIVATGMKFEKGDEKFVRNN